MTVTVTNIIPRKLAEDIITNQYTSSEKTIIDSFTATNVSLLDVTFNCWLPASGDAEGNNNLVVNSRTIAPKETYRCPELIGKVLLSGGYISTLIGAPDSIVISSEGRLIS